MFRRRCIKKKKSVAKMVAPRESMNTDLMFELGENFHKTTTLDKRPIFKF